MEITRLWVMLTNQVELQAVEGVGLKEVLSLPLPTLLHRRRSI
jgi:hypothetical protein